MYKLIGCRLLSFWCVQVHLGDVRLHNSQPLSQLVLCGWFGESGSY